MKTNELILNPIDNKNHVDLFWETIKDEPAIDNMHKEDWIGEFIYDIYYKNNHVGFIAYSIWEESCCLSCIYIFEPYRRLGIASAAIRKIMYMNRNYNFFYGFVHKDNKAIKMYQKLELKFLNKFKTGYTITEPSPDNSCLYDDFYEFGKENK